MGLFPFGFCLIALILIVVWKNKKMEAMFKAFFVFELVLSCGRFNYGYLFILGGNEIAYNDVLLAILFILAIYVILRRGYANRKLFQVSVVLLLVIAVGIVRCYMNPADVVVIDYSHSWDKYFRGFSSQLTKVHYSKQSLLMYFRVIIFITIINAAKIIFKHNDWINIGNEVLKYLKISIIYGIIEIFMKFVLHVDMNTYLNWFFGKGISTGGGVTRLQGICREPSYYALALFNFILLSLIFNFINNKKKIDWWIITAIFIGCISTSFSFLICLVAIVILWLIMRSNIIQNRQRTLIFVAIFAISFITLFVITRNEFINYASSSSYEVLNRIAEAILQIKKGIMGSYILGTDYSSEASRLIGGIISFKAGLSRPIFGLGLGTVYCVTGLIAIFANIGISGLVLWIYLLFGVFTTKIKRTAVLALLLPVLFCNDLYTLYDTSYILIIPLLAYYFTNYYGGEKNAVKQ